MRIPTWRTAFALLLPAAVAAQSLPIDDAVLAAVAQETSGESAKRNLDRITLYHRTRAGSQFLAAAEHVQSQLRAYGYADARILTYPADGKTMFGTQKSRPAWEVEAAELWEVDASGARLRRLGDWESMPLSLAQDSLSGSATTTLVDIAAGTSEAHYAGKDVRGKLVLTDSQPEAVAALAVGKHGAAGIVSYAANQNTAWWKEDARLVRWGHLSSFPEAGTETFAFMISLGEARALQARLASGEAVRLQAQVAATHAVGKYALVEAVIAGTDPAVAAEQIVISCHLDHPRPGANDNASGCAATLETARTLKRLIDGKRIPAPRRGIRFVWPAEIEGTLIYLNADPALAQRIKANIHLDMVGGDASTKAVYRISGGPYSLPTFIADLGHAIGAFVNAQTLAHASGEPSHLPLVAPEGGKEPLLAVMEGLSMGSDHDVYREGSWRIPGLYLHDWPDRYIHTNFDAAANIDPTKLKRSAYIAALSAWYLASMDAGDAPAMLALLKEASLRRAGDLVAARAAMDSADAAAITRVHWAHEAAILASVEDFAPVDAGAMKAAKDFLDALKSPLGGVEAAPVPAGEWATVYRRNADIRGPMHAFGYSFLEDHLDASELALLTLDEARAYEALNLVDGRRSVAEINDWLLAAFGSVDRQAVLAYLQALARIDVVRQVDES